jgi:hypothetical protein
VSDTPVAAVGSAEYAGDSGGETPAEDFDVEGDVHELATLDYDEPSEAAGWDATDRTLARLGAIIEGRTTPPTDAEFATHDAAGGSWRIVTHAVGTRILAEDGYQRDVAMWAHAEMLRDAMAPGGPLHGADVRWWALDAEGRPCAWPVVSQ